MDSTGVAIGAANGIGICVQDSGQYVRTMIPDALGGAIVGWDDKRSGTNADIYVQSVAPNGSLRWASTGVLLATGAGTRSLTTSAPDGHGGGVFAWEDLRNGTDFDVYAFRLTSLGTGVEALDSPRAATRLLPARPNPFNPNTVLEFTLGAPSRFRLAIHDVQGRLVRVIAEGEAQAGRRTYRWDGLADKGTSCGSGVYYAVLSLPTGRRSTALTLIR